MRILVSITCLLIVAGCGHDAGHGTHSDSQASAEHHPTGLALELDNGKKWQVDEHTRASARKMVQIIQDTEPIASVEDARGFAEALNGELMNLIQGCTMTGPAHDQLHVVLAALFPRISDLKNKTDPEELRPVQEEIAAVFDAYEQHFE